MNRRVAQEGVKLWKVVDSKSGRVCTDVGDQVNALFMQPKFVDILVMLVESRSIDVNVKVAVVEGSTTNPLILASTHGYLPVVQALLQGGADMDKADDRGATPLVVMLPCGHDVVVVIVHIVDIIKYILVCALCCSLSL
jgi:ankyrin repeat protein